ncbi:hypothetical protein HJC23_012838 [Cyclotella cryptica]|uniref:Uncharacterized protein n=1 Tax=Cyclotella cryptica TaxID=29204 RepID=A0ABD3Q3A1_9STRA
MDSPCYSIDAEEELRELYSVLDEKERHIQDLEAELERRNSADFFVIQEENNRELEKYRDELIECRDTNADLTTQLTRLREENKELLNEKEQLNDDLIFHKSQIDAQRSQIAHHTKVSEDVKRQQNDGIRQLQRLELENQRLRATILELEENEDILVNEIETLVKEKSLHQERCDSLHAKCDSLYADLDEKGRINSDLLKEQKQLQCDLESEKAAHAESERRNDDCRLQIAKLNEQIDRGKEKQERILNGEEYELSIIELAKARNENQRLLSALNQCTKDKNQSERDLDSAIHALNESKLRVKEEVALAARKEKAVATELRGKLDKAEQKGNALLLRISDLENLIEDLHKQLDNSEARNSRYEEYHGLSEVVRHQKRLEADLRRRDYDLKRINEKLGTEIEKRTALAKAVELLKVQANLSPDFKFDDEELQSTLLREDNKLKSENAELSRQVDALEVERTKLLTHIRQQAIDISEKGTRFLGMDHQQMALVIEFATNLRNGRTDLPLNDKSKDLTAQITSLQSQIEVDKVTIQRLERENFCLTEERCPFSPLNYEGNAAMEKIREETGDPCTDEASKALSSSTPTIRDVAPMPSASDIRTMRLVQEFDSTTRDVAPLIASHLPESTQSPRRPNVQPTKQDDVVTSSNASAIEHKTFKENKNANESINESDDLALCRYHVEHFRHCSHMVKEENKKLRDMVSQLCNERDALSLLLVRNSGDVHYGDAEIDVADAENSNVTTLVSTTNCAQLEIRCKSLETELKRERQSRNGANMDDMKSEMMKRIMYLEQWKANAMTTIENQLKSIDSSVNKSCYVEALDELENLKLENILLMDRLSATEVSLLQYREIVKSFGCSVDEKEKVGTLKKQEETSSPSIVAPHERIQALSVENSSLFERLVAYQEREHFIKSKMNDAIAACSAIKSKYAGGMTASETANIRKDNDSLKLELSKAHRSVLEYKEMVDLSASQVSALMALKKEDPNEVTVMPMKAPRFMYPTTIELEQCESKLSEARSQILDLQISCRSLVCLVQRVTKNNWYSHSHIYEVIFGDELQQIPLLEVDTDGISISAASKLKTLSIALENLQTQVSQNENRLDQLRHEKELLQTKLSRFHSSDIFKNHNSHQNELFQQLLQTKAELFSVQRELRQTKDENQIFKTKVALLEKSNVRLENESANAELAHLANRLSMPNVALGALLSIRADDDTEREQQKMTTALKQTAQTTSQYLVDLSNLYSKYSALQANYMQFSRVCKQAQCLKEIIQEKNRLISVTKQKLAEAKQMNLKQIRPRQKYDLLDDSSSLGTISSIGNLTKSSPKRGVLESRLEDASRLIASKDKELELSSSKVQDLGTKLADMDESLRCLSKQLDDTIKQSELQQADISTLVTRLGEEESKIAEMESIALVQKQMLEGSCEENEKLKAKLTKVSKERKEADSTIKTLEADIERSKRLLSVARQGRARSENCLKEETEKAAKAQESITKMSDEVEELKTKLLAATEEKLAASKKARVAASKIKALSQECDQKTNEKLVNDLEKRVNVLNQTVSGLATQNSKLRGELTKLKREGENGGKRENNTGSVSRTRPGSRAICKDCKTMEERISSLEQSLSTEKKHCADSRHMLDMYQKRSFSLEQALQKYSQDESKYASPRSISSSSVNRCDAMKNESLDLSKENKRLREEIERIQTERAKELAEKNALEKENIRMAGQLEAFDLDFFEEIGNMTGSARKACFLTEQYNEAVRQLNELANGG